VAHFLATLCSCRETQVKSRRLCEKSACECE